MSVPTNALLEGLMPTVRHHGHDSVARALDLICCLTLSSLVRKQKASGVPVTESSRVSQSGNCCS